MEINDTIAQLGTKLDEWWKPGGDVVHSKTARPKARLSFAELRLQRIDRIKAKGLAALKALLRGENRRRQQDRVASLVKV